MFRKLYPVILFWCALWLLPVNTSAQSQIDSLRAVLESETDDSVLVLTEIELSREIHRQDHQPEEEYKYGQRAVDRALALEDTLLYARASDNLGLLYRYHQQYAEAVPLHTQAFQLIEILDADPYFYMRFANNIGVAARHDQLYETAAHYFLEALKIAEEEHDLRNIAISSNGLGNTLSDIPGREDEAIEYFYRALETEKERENSLGIAINYLSISEYYIRRKEFNMAHKYLNELLKVNRERKDTLGLAYTYESFGHNYFQEGKDIEQALSWHHRSLALFQQLGDLRKQADLLKSLGDVHVHQANTADALSYYDSSMQLAKRLNNRQLIMENALAISAIYEAQTNPSDALHYYKLAQQYKDSINLSEQETQIAALRRKYDLEKKEAEIELLEKDRDLQQAQLANQQETLKRHRTFLWLMGVGLTAILVIFLMQYRNVRIRRKANALLQKREKERLQAVYEKNLAQTEMLAARMQMNPHFLFNCLNSIKVLIQKDQNKKATSYLVVFSRFIRMVLERGKNHVIPLTEELELIRSYLKLEKNRFDQDFSYHINIQSQEDLGHIYLPPLLLQPFVENAIWHGLLPSRRDQKQLQIDIDRSNGTVEIIIDDNGVGRSANRLPDESARSGRKSMGMEITQERIDLFNENYDFDISCNILDKKEPDGTPTGTRVVICLDKIEEQTPIE